MRRFNWEEQKQIQLLDLLTRVCEGYFGWSIPTEGEPVYVSMAPGAWERDNGFQGVLDIFLCLGEGVL